MEIKIEKKSETTLNKGIDYRHVCPTCSQKVEGRSDKIFCCITCKNKHHSNARLQFKSRFENNIARIRRNYVVLEGILGKEYNRFKIHKDALFEHGFDISYAMRSFKKGKGTIKEIGEYQFREFENGVVEVIRMTSLSNWMPGFFERWLVDFPMDWKVGKVSNSRCKKLNNINLGRIDE